MPLMVEEVNVATEPVRRRPLTATGIEQRMLEADGDAGVLGVPPRLRKLTAEERRILMLPHELTTTSAPGSRSATGALVPVSGEE